MESTGNSGGSIMRMWMVDPALMCNKHLLGEHVETHMLCGSIRKGISMNGFIRGNIVQLKDLRDRHDSLASEMTKRGMNHKSPLPEYGNADGGSVDIFASLQELKSRCPECRSLIEDSLGSESLVCRHIGAKNV